MQVGLVAVAGVDACDLLVGAVGDDLFALAEALRRDDALPPRQDRLAVVLLHLQVGRFDAARQRVKPDDVAGFVEDQRTAGTGAAVGGGEQIASCRRRGARRHLDGRRLEVRQRAEMLHLVVVAADRLVGGGRVADRVLARDGEVEAERRRAARAADPAAHGDGLAGAKRVARAGSSRRLPGSRRPGAPDGGRSATRSP